MKKEIRRSFIVIFLMIVFSFAGSYSTAGAYALTSTTTGTGITTTATKYLDHANNLLHSTSSLPASPSWLTSGLNAVSSWFGTMMAHGGQSTSVPQLSGEATGVLGTITVNVQHGFQNFDAWFAGIFHFHLAIIFSFVFGVVIWMLGLAQSIVSWLASLFK